MNSTQVIDWQDPFVDIFKYYSVFDGSGHDKKGNVGIFQDNSIGRRVFKVQGSISAVNHISFPTARSNVQTLGVNGKYVYIEFLPTEVIFLTHLEFTIPGRNPVRFSISNMYETYKVASNTLQIPFPRDIRNKWCVLCIDIEQCMEKYNLFPPNAFKSFKKIYVLKAVQICATQTVRGIYTSNNKYTVPTLPREMDFKMPKGNWEDFYKFLYLPETETKPTSSGTSRASRSILKKTSSLQEAQTSSQEKKKSKSKKRSESPKKGAPKEKQVEDIHPVDLKAKTQVPEKPPVKVEERMRIPWYRPPVETVSSYIDQKSSMLSLEYVLGFTGRRCPDVRWSQDPEHQDEILFASGKLVVGHNPETGEQRFFFGNTSPVCCLDISKDGSRLVTAQEDFEPCVKVFDYCREKCLGTIPLNMKEIRSISISYNKKYVSVTGVDDRNRDVLNIWDIETLEGRNKPELVAKQTSEFNILTCKFSPIEPDKLVSCGKENIRFWRIKGDHISGGAVVLNQHARDTVFTVLEYDFNHENPATALQSETTKRVFVGTKHGLLFQINYMTRDLEGVFKIHDSAICSLAVSAGFCVTGSEDLYLRVWPLDFSEYFLEAKHEGIIISLDISRDALKVTCGVSSGGIGMLNLGNQSYRTLLRSHADTIKVIDYHAFSSFFLTLSEDLTIRVWDSTKLEQMYEFTYSRDDLCTCISSYPRGLFFAAGFQSGILRIFDIDKTCIVEESKYHNSPMTSVLYSPDGRYLITADAQSNYNLFDVERGLQPVKVFEAEIGNENPLAIFTNDSATLATTGSYTNHINFWDLYRFNRRGRIIIKSSTVKAMKFSSDDFGLFVLLSDGKIKMYGVKENEPVLLKDISPANKFTSNSLDVSANNHYLLTGCEDSKVRVWDVINSPGEQKVVFPQEGHVDGVRSAVFSNDNHKVYTAGHDEGIYVWAFRGDLEALPEILDEELESFSAMLPGRNIQAGQALSKKDEEEVDKLGNDIFAHDQAEEEHKSPHLSEEKRRLPGSQSPPISGHRRLSTPMKEITNVGGRDSPYTSKNRLEGDGEEKSEKTQGTHQVSLSPLESRTQVFLKSPKSISVRKTIKFKKPAPNTRSPSPTKIPTEQRPGRKYIKSAIRKAHNLPFKHYALEGDSKLAQAKSKAVFKNRNRLELEYIVGYNNDAHSNIAWNINGGWFAYGTENYVIIEQLVSERSQKIVTLPDFVSCLTLNPDNSLLAIGAATYDADLYSNVHILDCTTFKIIRTLRFHNKGIQSLAFSSDGKYLISIGNYRECTIGVWDPSTGQLIASSYTLTNINEVKAKPYTRSGVLEFTTIGADQVIQWILTSDGKLLNSETAIPPKFAKTVELTAFNYVFVNNRDYILMGTAEGEIILFDLSSAEMELRRRASSEEIVDIATNNNELRAVITSMDSKIYFWDYSEKIKFDEEHNWKFIELKNPATCLYLDETLTEGLIGTLDGGILYAHLKEELFSKLVGASSPENAVVRVKDLDENIFVTFHALGNIKLWNAFSGEELAEFSYPKISCKDVLLHKGRSEIFCFYDDNTCKVVDLNNFEKVVSFIQDESNIQPEEGLRYIADSLAIQEQGQGLAYYLGVTNKGELYVSDLREKDEIVWFEALEQTYPGSLTHFNAHSKLRMMNICFDDATIFTYAFYRGNHLYPDIGLIDQWNLMDDPHGDLDKNEEALQATMTIYGTKVQRKYRIATAFTETRGLYYVITNYLQYVILRNYTNNQIVRRVSLESFPMSLNVEYQTKNLLVGLDDGWIIYYDFEGKELQRQRNFNDGSVLSLRISKNEDQKKLVAIEPKAMTIYKYQ